MLLLKKYFAYLLVMSMAVPAYCSDNKTDKEDNQSETSDPGYTMTLLAVYADPNEPVFPRAEISRALILFMDRYTHGIDTNLNLRLADVLEKFPEGQAEDAVRKLLSLKEPVDGPIRLLEVLPPELAPHSLDLLVKQGLYVNHLLSVLSMLPRDRLVPVVKKFLSWPDGALNESLVAGNRLASKHALSIKGQSMQQFLTDVNFMLIRPLDAKGHERAKAILNFESRIFFKFLRMSQLLPATAECQNLLIDILSELRQPEVIEKVKVASRPQEPNSNQPAHQAQEKLLVSGSEGALADGKALNKFFKALSVASRQQIDMSFKLASPFIKPVPATSNLGGMKLTLLSILLSMPENRMQTFLTTLQALVEKDPKTITNLINLIYVIKILIKFPLEEMDQLAEKLVYFCGDDFENVIRPLSELPEKQLRLVLEKTYDFCNKREVTGRCLEGIIRSVLMLQEHRVTSSLNATDSLFCTVEQVKPRLKELFASRYKSVIIAYGRIPADELEAIENATNKIMSIGVKNLISLEDEPVESANLSVGFSPERVIDNLSRAKLNGLDAALLVSTNFFENSRLDCWHCAEIVAALSWIKPDRMKSVAQAFERIYKDQLGDLPTQTIIQNLSKLPTERMDEFRLVVQRIMTAEQKLDYYLNQAILSSIALLPVDQVDSFVNSSIESLPTGNILIHYANSLEEEHQARLFQHWTYILGGDDIDQAQELCEFITEFVMELGLNEDHAMVQLAIRIQSVLDNEDDHSPYVIYERLKQKKQDPIDWAALKPVKDGEDGLYMSLNHQGLAKFGASIVMDLSSVPKVDSKDFAAMLDRLKLILATDLRQFTTQQLKNSLVLNLDDSGINKGPLLLQAALMMRDSNEVELISRHEAGIVEEAGSDAEADLQRLKAETVDGFLQRLGKGFINVLDHAKEPKSHMCTLMSAPVNSTDASKLKCVVNYLMHITNEREKTQRMCQFFAGVRNCSMGQNTAIQDYYVHLPDEYRIHSKGGIFESNGAELPAMKALYHVVQSVISIQFSSESVFMKEVCGIKTHEEIIEAAHQINYMKGLIGDRVGLLEGARFDINSQCIYESILEMPLQRMMQMFYEHVELKPIVAMVKSSLDVLIKAETGSGHVPIYEALMKIHNSYAKTDTIESWIEYRVLDDDVTFVPEGISQRGVMRLMQHGGILNEIDAALPW